MTSALLQVRSLCSGYGKREVIHDISFEVAAGELCCIIGANGCGKTTVLKSVLGLIARTSGCVIVCDKDTQNMSVSQRARHFAYIPQLHVPPFPFTVADVVILGRTPYLSSVAAKASHADELIACQALEQLGIEDLAFEVYSELSGGQQQLVLIARALAQQPDLLVMDEPTASLDFGNQQMVLARLCELVQSGMAILMVTHDPDHALSCADKVVVMEKGRIIAQGAPHQMITNDIMLRIYRTEVKVADIDTGDGCSARICVPLFSGGRSL